MRSSRMSVFRNDERTRQRFGCWSLPIWPAADDVVFGEHALSKELRT